MKKNLLKYTLEGIAIISILLVLVFLIFPRKKPNTYRNYEDNNQVFANIPMENSHTYSQEFISKIANIESIIIKFSTYNKVNIDSILEINIFAKDELIENFEINAKEILDNKDYIINTNNLKNVKDEVIKIEISYKNYNNKDCVAFWVSNEYDDFQLTNNTDKENKKMIINYVGLKNDYTFIWYLLMILFGALALLCLTKEGKEDDSKK